MTTFIELRLAGNGVSPGFLRSREVAELIITIEDAIATLVNDEEPSLKKEEVRVGLAQIADHSIGFQFAVNMERYTVPAFQRLGESVATGRFDRVSRKVYPHLRKIVSFTKRYDCRAEMRILGHDLEHHVAPIAVMTSETIIPDLAPFSGATVIYGTVTRVGGAEPKIQFRTIQGDLLHCTASFALAVEAGEYLYKTVALQGIAEWNGETLKIDDFHAQELIPYQPTDPAAAFAELAELIDDSFFDTDDEDHFLNSLPYEDMPEMLM